MLVGHFEELMAAFVEHAHVTEVVLEGADRELGHFGQRIEVFLVTLAFQ